jgi:hypothetical protein
MLDQFLGGRSVMERQWVITQARIGKITSEDMDYQLGSINLQEIDVKKKMSLHSEVLQTNSLKDWEEITLEYLNNLKAGLEWLKTAPLNEEERVQKFNLKQRLVRVLVEKIVIGKDRQITITLALDLLRIIAAQAQTVNIQPAGTYSRKRSSPCALHPRGSCA